MEEKYHRIVIDGEPYYREYCASTERYGSALLTQEELIDMLLDEVVEDTIEVDHYKIQGALRRLGENDDTNLIRNYILFLERLMED